MQMTVVRAAVEAGVKMQFAHVQSNIHLRTLWRWVFIEMMVRDELCAGIRWGFISDAPTQGFVDLATMALPSNRAIVKNNSTVSLLNKVISSFENIVKANGGSGDKTGFAKFFHVKREGHDGTTFASSAAVSVKRTFPEVADKLADAPKAKAQKLQTA